MTMLVDVHVGVAVGNPRTCCDLFVSEMAGLLPINGLEGYDTPHQAGLVLLDANCFWRMKHISVWV